MHNNRDMAGFRVRLNDVGVYGCLVVFPAIVAAALTAIATRRGLDATTARASRCRGFCRSHDDRFRDMDSGRRHHSGFRCNRYRMRSHWSRMRGNDRRMGSDCHNSTSLRSDEGEKAKGQKSSFHLRFPMLFPVMELKKPSIIAGTAAAMAKMVA